MISLRCREEAEGRRQKAEGGKQKAEGRKQKAEAAGKKDSSWLDGVELFCVYPGRQDNPWRTK